MENFIFYINGVSESWSLSSADQFFSMFPVLSLDTPAARQFASLIQYIAATVFVALLAWYATKKMARARGLGRKGGNLSVVESVNVGGQAAVQLVRVGDKYLVVGVTRERVTLLSEVDKDQITEPEPVDFTNLNTPFGKVLSRFIQPKDPRNEDKDE
jgi:flagellar protein FliO/FliZ